MRIVVADDEPDLTDFYQDALARLGHKVFVAHHGRQLVELCRQVRPDLVITDLHMPQMNGIEAVRQVYQETLVPAIVVSASDHVEFDHSLTPHLVAILRKPVGVPDLEKAIALVAEGQPRC